ncbi:MAG: hypothetical protein IKU64_05360 [Bacteroides sp.]|nr:hypothetical protein [Bacteroides sp.]
MSNYTYADGAIHNDHHKEMTINVSGKTDIAALMKAFMANDAEVVEEMQEEVKETSSEQTLEGIKNASRKGGRKAEPLFQEDTSTQQWATLFVEYLKLHKTFSKEIDTSKENYVSKAFVVFYGVWEKRKLVASTPNGNACYQFLLEDCALQMKAEKKTYANHIRNMINGANDLDLIDIESNVHTFLNTHKQ